MPEEPDQSVLADPAAEEAYIYLRRSPGGLTAEQLAASGVLSLSEAQAGLRALMTGNLAVTDDDETFLMAPVDGAGSARPIPPATSLEDGSGPDASDAAVPAPPAPRDALDGLARMEPQVILALARGERVRLLVRGWCEVKEGVLNVVEVLDVEEARLPGERPLSG